MKVLLLILMATFTSSSYAYFWVDDGTTIRADYYLDEDQFDAEEWRILLFKRGDSADPSHTKPWGSISGNSASEVRSKLEKSQSTEKKWEKWTGISWGELTSFNPLGPIAVVHNNRKSDKVKDLAKALLNKIDEKWRQSDLGQDIDKAKKSIEEIKRMFQYDVAINDVLDSTSNSDRILTGRLNGIGKDIAKINIPNSIEPIKPVPPSITPTQPIAPDNTQRSSPTIKVGDECSRQQKEQDYCSKSEYGRYLVCQCWVRRQNEDEECQWSDVGSNWSDNCNRARSQYRQSKSIKIN